MDRHRIFVLATTLDETRHALEVAQSLAETSRSELAVIVPLADHATVSSARANVEGLDVADLDVFDPDLTASSVRSLFAMLSLEPEVIVSPALSSSRIAQIVPAGSTVIICGPMHRFFETRQQRIVRELAKRGQDVVFLPFPDPRPPVDSTQWETETEIMRRLVC